MRVESRQKEDDEKDRFFWDTPRRSRSIPIREDNTFFFSSDYLPARFRSMSPHWLVCILVPFHSLVLSPLVYLQYYRARTTYAYNESERTEHRKRGISGRNMHEKFDRAYRKTEVYTLTKFKFTLPNDS